MIPVLVLAAAGLVQAAALPQAMPGDMAVTPLSSAMQDRDLDCLATAISYEAGSESEAGQEAVAQVVVNRLHDPAFPKTVCGVVYQGSERRTGCQFTFTCDGSLTRWQPTRSVANARRIAARALAGAIASPIGTATFYHANYVAPGWATRMARVTQIGAHIFYRPVTAGLGAARQLLTSAAATGMLTQVRPGVTTLSVWGLKTATLAAVGDRIEVRQP